MMETPRQTRLEIKRVIKASRERVYAAWTDPKQMKEWFGPEGVRTRSVIADARVGGELRWELTSSEGEDMTVFGEYRELVPGRKIVFTWKWDDDEDWKDITSVVTLELADAGNGTELRLVHEQLPSEESRERHSEGWTKVLASLEQYFDKQTKG